MATKVHTYPLTGVEVPPVGIASASPAAFDIGDDVTPLLWPTSGKASAFEAEVTVIDEHFRDGQVVVMVSPDGHLAEIPGTWSGDPGVVGGWGTTNDATGWRFDKFGGWRTDYLTFVTSGASANQCTIAHESAFEVTSVDVRVRCRRADWDAVVDAVTEQTIVARASNTAGPWRLSIHHSSGGYIRWRQYSTNLTSSAHTVTASLANVGVVDGQWIWLRAVGSSAGATLYSSTDGASWSAIPSTSSGTPANIYTASSTPIRVGAELLNNRGFGGDISDVEFRSGGALLAAVTLDAMDSSTDTAWTTAAGNSVTRGSTTSPAATGAIIPATARARFEFDTPTDVGDWRLFVDADAGSVSIDELVLEMERRNGHHLGLVRGRRG